MRKFFTDFTAAASVLMFFGLLSCSCDKSPASEEGTEEQTFDVSYTESDVDFINPERGFYTQYTLSFKDGNIPSPVAVNTLQSLRLTGKSLSLTLFYLTDFMEGDISAEALDVIAKSFQAHRDAGCKTVLRFAYKNSMNTSDQPWDAPVDIVLRHVEQLAPLFREYGDIIYVLQAGFVGSWGEWYYTSHFNRGPSTDEEWEPRRKLVRALLDALPESRQVALRTANYKMKCLGTGLADSITVNTAFDGSDISRLAGHNDCFLADGSDMGTFSVSGERELWKAETNYVSMGGETCAASAPYCGCEKALAACRDYHWSYLNSGYNTATHAIWRSQECFDEISLKLGYRFVLRGGNFGKEHTAGAAFPIQLQIENVGFASLINERGIEFILVRKGEADTKYVFETDIDPRTWKGGTVSTLDYTITLPADIVSGAEYNLYINLPDASENLRLRPEFSVRFANENVWDETTGYNLLTTFKAL